MRGCRLLFVVLILGLSSCSRDPEVVKRKYLESGNRYFEKKQYKEASIMYRQALRKDPRYGEAYYRLALTQLRLNRIPEAIRSLRRAVELLPDRLEPKVQLGDLYLTGLAFTAPGNTRQIEYLRNEIKNLADLLPPSSPHRHRLLGYYFLSQKQLKEALAEFRQAHELQPFRPEFTLPLVETLFNAGQAEEAEKLGRALIEKQPQLAAAYDVLYLHYVRSQRDAEAEAVLKDKAAHLGNEASVWLQMAAHYYRAKKFAEMQRALDHLTSNLKQFPDAYQLAGDFSVSGETRTRLCGTTIRAFSRTRDGGCVIRKRRRQYWRTRVGERKPSVCWMRSSRPTRAMTRRALCAQRSSWKAGHPMNCALRWPSFRRPWDGLRRTPCCGSTSGGRWCGKVSWIRRACSSRKRSSSDRT
jgi:tetratricopeptide (TPR) repeat protein